MRVKKQTRNAGFTLIELLVTVAIIGIISAIAIPNLLTAIDKSKQQSTIADMRSIGTALSTYHIDNSQFPNVKTSEYGGGDSFSDLCDILVPVSMSVLPQKDRFNHTFGYDTNVADSYTIESYGKDGINGLEVDKDSKNDFTRDIILTDGTFTHDVLY